ncbi:MAG: RNHCP domain protein [Parcubacteria group bacterium ADurb.Bin316]|nr:MAG: RNHCP domain protein [Parcubacteria group bacterium ADurb.Bin316]HOZ56026.1 RNHCP domain-containing protein [bacterium]
MAKRFTKRVENFHCAKCGRFVEGNGFTDHCPHCLTGKHVDNNPGDRASECGGLMKPIGIEKGKKDVITLIYLCSKCGVIKKNKASVHDDMDKIIEVSKESAQRRR